MTAIKRTQLQADKVHPTSQQFKNVLDSMWELHRKKGADYGTDTDPFANVRNSEAFGMPAWVGAVLRAQDKMVRIQKASTQAVAGDPIAMANESVQDSLIDLAAYAVIALVLFNETVKVESISDALEKAVRESEDEFPEGYLTPAVKPERKMRGCACGKCRS